MRHWLSIGPRFARRRGQDHAKLPPDEFEIARQCIHNCKRSCINERPGQSIISDWVLQHQLQELQLKSCIPCCHRTVQLPSGFRDWEQEALQSYPGAVNQIDRWSFKKAWNHWQGHIGRPDPLHLSRAFQEPRYVRLDRGPCIEILHIDNDGSQRKVGWSGPWGAASNHWCAQYGQTARLWQQWYLQGVEMNPCWSSAKAPFVNTTHPNTHHSYKQLNQTNSLPKTA